MRRLALALCLLPLAGCGLLKQKSADYYLAKARKTAELPAPGEAQVRAAFADIDKALDHAPASEAAVPLLRRLSQLASKGGFPAAQELEAGALKKALAAAPANWAAREALTGYYAERGDTGGLEALAEQARSLSLSASGDPRARYAAALSGLYARAAALPWLESEAYLAINKSPEKLFSAAAACAAGYRGALELQAAALKLAAADPGLRMGAPKELASAAEVAAGDALGDGRAREAVLAFAAAAEADPAFRKAVEQTVLGNAALLKKDFAQARAYYQGALNHYPGLTEARRQLAEADFQEGAALAATGADPAVSSRLLYKAYAALGPVLAEAAASGPKIPFIRPQRFAGEAWSLKAACVAALRAVQGGKLKNAARMEAEFKGALDEALKLNPEGRLAREMLERYTKEGF